MRVTSVSALYQVKAVGPSRVFLGDIDDFLLRLHVHQSYKRLVRGDGLATGDVLQREPCRQALVMVGFQLNLVGHLQPTMA